ncbi:MAG: porin [Isosphaeraceae bacterium]
MSNRQRRKPLPWLGLPPGLGLCAGARGQEPPDPSPFGQPSRPATAAPTPPLLPTPSPTTPPAAVSPSGPGPSSGCRRRPVEGGGAEDRVRQLESMIQQLSTQIQQMQSAPAAPAAAPDTAGWGTNAPPGSAPGPGTADGAAGSPAPAAGPAPTPPAAPGQSLAPNPPANARFDSPARYENKPANVKFGPGFEIRSEDEEFIFQFHNITQIDYRGYEQGGQNPVHNTFGIPRQWFMFSGRITKPFGYFVSLAHGFDTVSLLDVFMDVSYTPKLQARVGRFKTPFTYEFLIEPVQGLLNPERSVFFNNFGQNRDIGAMAFGRLFDNKFDYAVGVFNGTRNGVLALQDSKAVSGLINYKPWGDREGSVLENFNVGGSVFTVNAYQPALPQVLRTVIPTGGNSILGVPFLAFNNDVRETGNQAFWDLHMAWFYKQLAVIAEWGSGAQDYSLTSRPQNRTRLGVESYYVQAGYLLTGETRSSVGIVKPLHPFDLRKGQRGPGAWELVARYQSLDIGNEVFTNGLSDPNNWANRLYITDLGFNWHLTQYLKLYFEWEHAVFNQPVLYAPNLSQLTSDLFLVRFQLYF